MNSEVDFKLEVPIDWEPLEERIVEESKALIYENTIKYISNTPDHEMRNFLKFMREGRTLPTYPRINGIVCELVYDLVSEYLDKYLKQQTEAIRAEVVDGLIQKITKRKGFVEIKEGKDLKND